MAALASSDYPCVMLDVDLLSDRIAFVMSDNIGGGIKATRHLVESGRRRIAFIGGRGDERPSVDRHFGYQSELARSSLPCPEGYVAMARWLPNLAFEATQAFLALPEPPDAVFCANEFTAAGKWFVGLQNPGNACSVATDGHGHGHRGQHVRKHLPASVFDLGNISDQILVFGTVNDLLA